MTKLQVIGGGKMGQALVGGMIGSGWAAPAELVVVEPSKSQQDIVVELFPGVEVKDQPQQGLDCLVAVKPHLVVPVCAVLLNPTRILSIAAGVTTATIEAAVGEGVPVVRAMPNTPALVGAGAAGVAGGTHALAEDLDWALEILGSVGTALVVEEKLIDAVTGLAGSGPAYVFLMAEALTDAGVAMGLTRDAAQQLAAQTLYGAGRLMVESSQTPVELRAAVTTPAGTTAAGLAALEQGSFRATVAAAVRAATERSIELGRDELS